MLDKLNKLKKSTQRSGAFYAASGDAFNKTRCTNLAGFLEEAIEHIRKMITNLGLVRVSSADSSSSNDMVVESSVASRPAISLKIQVPAEAASVNEFKEQENNLKMEIESKEKDAQEKAVVSPVHNNVAQVQHRPFIPPNLVAAAVDAYPDIIKNFVVPAQGADIIMLPNATVRYQLEPRAIKETIYGHVHVAHRVEDGKLVIVKRSFLHNIVEKAHGFLENPFNEVRLAWLLPPHRNLVEVYEVTYDDVSHWVVMEFCGGGEFFDLITEARISSAASREYFRQMVVCAIHMHDNGIAHLDISLENILLSSDQTCIKLIDFGHSREILFSDDGRHIQLAFPGNIQRQPSKKMYRAPEIWLGREFYGPKADTFSLGVVLFVLVTGLPPFEYALHIDERYRTILQGRLAVCYLIILIF